MLKNKILNIFFIFIVLNITLNATKVSNIRGIEKLSNYNEIKNVEIERIIDYDNYERNKKINRVYVNGETVPFSGVAVRKIDGKIRGLYFYKDGISERSSYSYHNNGQLSLVVPQKNDKNEGKGTEYYENGKLRCNIEYKNDIDFYRECYNTDGSLMEIYKNIKGNSGILTGYYKGTNKKRFTAEAMLDYSKRGRVGFINHGTTLVYERNGSILGELNFNNGSLLGERQKLYKNGKLKYDFIGGTKDIKGLKAMRSYIEYYDNSDIMKYSCDEVTRDNWKCKEYSKDGSFKQNVDGRKYVSVNNNHHGNIWINIFLGAWNILNP